MTNFVTGSIPSKFLLAGALVFGPLCHAQPVEGQPIGDFRAFFQSIHPITAGPIVDADLDVHCRARIDDAHVSFIGTDPDEILIVALTGRRFSNPEKNLLFRVPPGGPPRGGTRDWGYIFDRNYDGRVDYLVFLDGVNAVVPDDWEGELPNLTQRFTGRELREIVLPNSRPVFWHMGDDNFDGEHDAVAASFRNLDNGWMDGWINARDTDFDGRYEFCMAFERTFVAMMGLCEGTADGYEVPGRRISGLMKVPPDPGGLLPLINEGAAECELTGESFFAR